jgi:hypothetical protein
VSAPSPGEPIVQRSCALCGVVDHGPRNIIVLPSGREAYYHVAGSQDCRVPAADPHPEFEESAGCSQLRHALTNDPGSPSPSPAEYIPVMLTDAQQPGTAGSWVEGFAPGTEPAADVIDPSQPGTER